VVPVDTSGVAVDSVIRYSIQIKPILATYCFGKGGQLCHVTQSNQGSGDDFTFYSGLKAKVNNGSLASRVFNPVGGMPPDYSNGPRTLTDKDMATLKKWVSQGAPNN